MTMNSLTSTGSGFFLQLAGPSQTGRLQFNYKWLEIETIQQNFAKIVLNLTVSHFGFLCKMILNLSSVSIVQMLSLLSRLLKNVTK